MFYIMHMHILWYHAKEDPSKGDQKNEPIQRGPKKGDPKKRTGPKGIKSKKG